MRRQPLNIALTDPLTAHFIEGTRATRLFERAGIAGGTIADIAKIDAEVARRWGYPLHALRHVQNVATAAGTCMQNARVLAVTPRATHSERDDAWSVTAVVRSGDGIAVSLRCGMRTLTVQRPLSEAARTHVGMVVRLALEPV